MAANEANIWQPRKKLDINADNKSVEETIIALQDQSTFVLSDFSYALNTGSLEVHLNGHLLAKDIEWQELTDSSFFILEAADAGDLVVATGTVGITGNVPVPADPLTFTEETITLTAGQTTVVFLNSDITDASIYIAGGVIDRGRLIRGLDFTATNTTTIELTRSYPVGTTCLAVVRDNIADITRRTVYLDTRAAAIAEPTFAANDIAVISVGGFESVWDIALSSLFPANGIDILQIASNASLVLKLRPGSEVNLIVMGASIIGLIDATNIIKRAVVLMKEVEGTVYGPKGVYLHSDTIVVDGDNVNFRGDGEGTVQGGIATLRASAATRFLYSNLAAPKPFYEFTSVTGDVPKSGGGMKGIMLDCDSTATTALTISSWRKGYFGQLHIYAPTSRGVHVRAFAGTLTSEPYDSQQNHLDNIEVHSKNVANAYVALLMTGGEGDGGANAGNSSFNYITNCFFKSENGTAVRLENTDNNYFYQVHGGGSASFFSLVLETDEGTTGNARFNQFHGCEFTGKGINAKAGQTGGLSSFGNAFHGLSKSNGAPQPTVGNGNGGSADATIIVDGVEEFNFIPTVEGTSTAGGASYTTQTGNLTRTADRVEFEIVLDYSAFTGTGNIIVQGLLFKARSGASVSALSIVAENLTFSGQLAARMIANTATIELVTIATGASASPVPVDSAAKLTISGSYMTQDN